MLQIHTVRVSELSADQAALWSRLQQADPALASPYFRPEFTQLVASVRDGVEIAILEQAGETVGFFPFQRGRFGVGRPVGGRLSDYHGVILRPDVEWTADALLRGCGLATWNFDHLPASQQAFLPHARTRAVSPYMDLSAGYDAYAAAVQTKSTHEVKQTQRKKRKFERAVGPLRFEFQTADRRVFKTLLGWKSAQYRRTGLTDVFAFGWTVSLLERLLERQDEALSGLLSALYAGDRLVAAQLSMRSHGVLHYWFPVYNLEFAPYSPGLMLLLEMAQAAPERGIRHIDLGKGTEQYKLSMMTGATELAEGSVERRTAAGLVQTGWRRTRDWVRSSALRRPAEIPLRWVRPLRERLAFR